MGKPSEFKPSSGPQSAVYQLLYHHGNHPTSVLHPKLENVDSGPSASSVEHDAVLVARWPRWRPVVLGRRPARQAVLRRPLGMELGGVSLMLDKGQVREQESQEDEDCSQLWHLHHHSFCASISC